MNASYQRERRARRRRQRRQVCASCGDVFVPSRSDQAFCSVACKGRDARRRKNAGEPPGKRRQPQPPFLEPTEPPAARAADDDLARQRADLLASLIG
jgi:hypothetical protein